MNAGRDLDALIAEKVMGWPPFAAKALDLLGEHVSMGEKTCFMCGRSPHESRECLPHYSTSIEAAWTVVEKLLPKTLLTLAWVDGWEVGHYDPDLKKHIHLAEADSAPLAICLAALKSVGA